MTMTKLENPIDQDNAIIQLLAESLYAAFNDIAMRHLSHLMTHKPHEGPFLLEDWVRSELACLDTRMAYALLPVLLQRLECLLSTEEVASW